MEVESNTNVAVDEPLEFVQTRKKIPFCKMYICKTKRWNKIALITIV
jgi:hypothetical protein